MLNYWGNISKTHVSTHSNDVLHTKIPPKADPSSPLLRNGIKVEEEKKDFKRPSVKTHPEPATIAPLQ